MHGSIAALLATLLTQGLERVLSRKGSRPHHCFHTTLPRWLRATIEQYKDRVMQLRARHFAPFGSRCAAQDAEAGRPFSSGHMPHMDHSQHCDGVCAQAVLQAASSLLHGSD